MSREIERLQRQITALTSQLRERDETIVNCRREYKLATGRELKLRAVLAAYQRGDEPTPAELADIAPSEP